MDIRNSARAVLINEENKILLFKFKFRNMKDNINANVDEFWITPGGGLEVNEDFEQALKRELIEETGLIIREKPTWVWSRDVVFERSGRKFMSHERYYIVYVKDCDVGEANLTHAERLTLLDKKWWSVEEMASSKEDFRPLAIHQELNNILINGLPKHPKVITDAKAPLI